MTSSISSSRCRLRRLLLLSPGIFAAVHLAIFVVVTEPFSSTGSASTYSRRSTSSASERTIADCVRYARLSTVVALPSMVSWSSLAQVFAPDV